MFQPSDNRHSPDDDSDAESLSSTLSPTDGYFEYRNHPQHLLVVDPSTVPTASSAESKAQEAREESQVTAAATSPASASAYPPAPSTYTSSSSTPSPYARRLPASPFQRQVQYSETSPLLHPAPPPAYSPATAPTTPPDAMSSQSYNSTDAPQVETASHQPESMGLPADYEDYEVTEPLWRRKARKFTVRRFITRFLLVLLVLTVSVTMLIAALNINREFGDHRSAPGQSKPVLGDPDRPDSENPAGSRSYCRTATFHKENYPKYDISQGGKLTITQSHDNRAADMGGSNIQTRGKLIFRHLPEDAAGSAHVSFDVWTTDASLDVHLSYDDSGPQIIKALSPGQARGLSSGVEHCISLEITAWLPPTATFQQMQVYTSHLGIDVHDDIAIYVEDFATFEAVSGAVIFPAIDGNDSFIGKSQNEIESVLDLDDLEKRETSDEKNRGITGREVSIHTESGSIDGAFSLYDVLSITTVSGNIDVSVDPKKASKENKPAVLELESKSGNIRSRVPVYDNPTVPDREYRTTLKTISGTVKGAYYIGRQAEFNTISGTIDIAVLPFVANEVASFKTVTISGTTKLNVLPLLADTKESKEAVLQKLNSSHESKSGSFQIQYPSEWAGELQAQTISGGIKIEGNDLHIIHDGRDGAYNKLIVRKGDYTENSCNTGISSISGRVEVSVGTRT